MSPISTKPQRRTVAEPRATIISEHAEYLADTYFSETSRVEPLTLTRKLGLPVHWGRYGTRFEGLTVVRGKRFDIFLNADCNEHVETPRCRFTLAHELGHCLIREHRLALMGEGTGAHGSQGNFVSNNPMEWEADLFAASLLMPASRLKRDVERRKFSVKLVNELAARYQMSRLATFLRFVELGNHPLMVVFAVDGRIRWYQHSPDFPFTSINATASFGVPVNSALGDFFYRHLRHETTQQVFARDWFRLYDHADYPRRFYEHCFYLEKLKVAYGVVWEE